MKMHRNPILKKYPKENYLLLCGLLFVFLITFKQILDPDCFWHIKSGEDILKYGHAAVYDRFSWIGTENHLLWMNHEWLFDLLIFLVYKVFYFTGVQVFVSVFASLLFYLIYRLCKIRTGNGYFGLAVSLLSVCGMTIYFLPRPQIVSYCLFVLFCIVMERKKYYLGIPIVILGVNFHSGVHPIYLILGAYYLFDEVCIKDYMKYLSLYFLATFINPYFYKPIVYTFYTMNSGDTMNFITEWHAVTPTKNVLYLSLLIALILLTRGVKIRFKDGLFIVVMSLFSLSSWRQIVFFFILVLPISSAYIYKKLSMIRDNEDLDSNTSVIDQIINSILGNFSLRKFGNVFLKLRIHYFLLALAFVLFLKSSITTQVSSQYPQKAVDYVKSHKEISRMWTDYNYGGYLIFNEVPTMIDGRADLFTDMFSKKDYFKEYVESFRNGTKFLKFLEKYKINYVFVENRNLLCDFLLVNPDFEKVYTDNIATVIKRRVMIE